MLVSKAKKAPEPVLDIVTTQGIKLEVVACYKYLGIWLDDCLTFKRHVNNLLNKLRVRLGFFYRNKSCFSLEARKRLCDL